MGCHIPRVPGYAPTDPATPTFTKCFTTPGQFTKKTTVAQYSLTGAPAPTITRQVSFVATVTAVSGQASDDYINYGCYLNSADLPGGVAGSVSGGFTVDSCVLACRNAGQGYAGLRIPTGGGPPVCRCGTGPPSGGRNNMEDCNQLCPGGNQQNCGPTAGLLVYATRGVSNPWEQEWSASYSNTPLYSCTST